MLAGHQAKEIATLKEQAQQKTHLESDNKNTAVRAAALHSQLQKTHKDLQDAHAKIASLKKEKTTVDLTGPTQDAIDRLQELLQKRDADAIQRLWLLQEANAKIASLENEKTALHGLVRNGENRIGFLQKELFSSQGENLNLQVQLVELLESLKASPEALHSQLQKARNDLQDAHAKIASLEKEKTTARPEAAPAMFPNGILDRRNEGRLTIQRLEEALRKKNAEKGKGGNKRIVALQDTIQRLQDRIDVLQKGLSSSQEENMALNVQLLKYLETIKAMKTCFT